MRILLPHRTVWLDSSLSIVDKKKVVDNLIEEQIEFHNETMTLGDYLIHTWHKPKSKTIMDMLGYYLTKGSNNEILSHDKEREMETGSYRSKNRYQNFSSLDEENKHVLGIVDKSDDSLNT